jgi:hypothetical protein
MLILGSKGNGQEGKNNNNNNNKEDEQKITENEMFVAINGKNPPDLTPEAVQRAYSICWTRLESWKRSATRS